MQDKYFEKLCNWLRDADGQEEVQRAAKALRLYLKEQQFTIRQRLNPYLEKAFSTLSSPDNRSN